MFVLVSKRPHETNLHADTSIQLFRLVHKGNVAICNLFILEVLQLIFSDLRLLIVERVSTCQYNMLKTPFVPFSQTAGTRLYWCRSHLTSATAKWHVLLTASNAFYG